MVTNACASSLQSPVTLTDRLHHLRGCHAETNVHDNASETPAALIALIQSAVAVTEAQLAGNVVIVEVTVSSIVEVAVTVVVSTLDTVFVVVPATKLYGH